MAARGKGTAAGTDPAACVTVPAWAPAAIGESDGGLTAGAAALGGAVVTGPSHNLTRRARILGPSARSTNPDMRMSIVCKHSLRRIA